MQSERESERVCMCVREGECVCERACVCKKGRVHSEKD